MFNVDMTASMNQCAIINFFNTKLFVADLSLTQAQVSVTPTQLKPILL